MMEENPILLWKIKCYKQKTSGKADLHTMYYLYIRTHTHTFNIWFASYTGMELSQLHLCSRKRFYSLLPFFAAISSVVHGFWENVTVLVLVCFIFLSR